jgi:N-acetylglucosamine-6-sulfatase
MARLSRRTAIQASLAASVYVGGRASAAPARQPNIVVVVVDDMRHDEYGAGGHPFLKTPAIDALAASGVDFREANVATPLCSPNRASILTGQYPSRHGVTDNVDRSLLSRRISNVAGMLQRGGYETAHVGKWHLGNEASPRPGYDHWVSFEGQGRIMDPPIWEDGGLRPMKGYVTDILTDRAVRFIRRPHAKPFFLYLGHKAIHPDAIQRNDASIDLEYGTKFIAAPAYAGRYATAVFPRAPSALRAAESLSTKPVLRRALDYRNSPAISRQFAPILDPGTSDETIRTRAEMMLSIDDSLGAVMAALRETGAADNTVVIFTSDNGYYFGEHGLSVERRLPYRDGARIPLILSDPRNPRRGRASALVQSLDIAPTLLELAGLPPDPEMQGRSLTPLLAGRRPSIRDALLIEYVGEELPQPWMVDMGYKAIRTPGFKFIHWLHFPREPELYDLAKDPHEIVNVAGEPAYRAQLGEMRAMLRSMEPQTLGL